MGATAWTLFHGLAKLGNFALRSFDLVLGDPGMKRGMDRCTERGMKVSTGFGFLSAFGHTNDAAGAAASGDDEDADNDEINLRQIQ